MDNLNEAAAKAEKRIQIGVRVAPDVKEMIERAAAANGRSLAQETELRIVESFNLDGLMGDARTKAFLIELASQIERAEAATGKSWRKDGATYWAALKLIQDAVRRADPAPPNYAEINAAQTEIAQLEAKARPLTEMLQRCGALNYVNALAAGGPHRVLPDEMPRSGWHMPDKPEEALGGDEVKLIEEWLAEWRDIQEKIVRLGARLEELQAPLRIARTGGSLIHKHLTTPTEAEAPAEGELLDV